MSLFKFRDWWTTNCGIDESFDKSIAVANVDNSPDGHDKIIVGSHSSILRIFSPSCETQATGNTLLLETQLKYPILDIKVGRFVSSTANLHLAVLHSRQLSVFAISAQPGNAVHGTSYNVSLIYEHNLQYSSFSLTIGPFGKVQGKDFMCVQSLDGTLSFFEQESFSFKCFLPGFLLPGPIAHLQYTDSIVLVSSYHLQCYKYQALAVSQAQPRVGDGSEKPKGLDPGWTYNLGENVTDIAVLPVPNCPAFITILGERHIFCVRETGILRFVKRMDAQPSCYHSYIHGQEMVPFFMVASHSKVLMVFEEVRMRWAAEIPFVPIAVLRANLKGLQGGLVLLSENGQLQCGYLGTAPEILAAVPVESREINYSEAEKELAELRKKIKTSVKAGATLNRNSSSTILMKVAVNEVKSAKLATVDETMEQNVHANTAEFRITIECCAQTPVCNVLLVIHCETSFIVSEPVHSLAYLENSGVISTDVKVKEGFTVSSLVGHAVATYTGPSGTVISQCTFDLPLKLVVFPVFPQKEAAHKITLAINKPAVSMETLFPEFEGDAVSGQAMAFKFYGGGATVTVLVAKASQRYRLQCDAYEAMYLLLHQITIRLKNHFKSNGDEPELKCTNLNKISLDSWMETVEEHFKLRLKSTEIDDKLVKATAQFRAIEKRLLSKFRDKNPSPLVNLDKLLTSTHERIMEVADAGCLNRLQVERATAKLTGANRLLHLLVKLQGNSSPEFVGILENAICPTVKDETEQGLEEIININLVHLLKTAKNTSKHKLPFEANLGVPIGTRDIQKHMEIVLEKFNPQNEKTNEM